MRNLENHDWLLASGYYGLRVPLPKHIFIKDYPVSPRNFEQKLRKARIDAGLKIKQLAGVVGVTEDTVINWEIRGIRPTSRSLERVEGLVARLRLNKAA